MIYPSTRSRIERELICNIPAFIPVVSTVSGALRAGVFGLGQGIIDLSVAVAQLAQGVFFKMKGNAESAKTAFNGFKEAAWFVMHDGVNIIHGLVDMIPLLGNALHWIYDAAEMRFGYNDNDRRTALSFAGCGGVDG